MTCPGCCRDVPAYFYSNGVVIPLCSCEGYIYDRPGRPSEPPVQVFRRRPKYVSAYISFGPLPSFYCRSNIQEGRPEFDGEHRITATKPLIN